MWFVWLVFHGFWEKRMESHENLHITIGRRFNVSPAKKTPSTHCVDLCQLWTPKLLIQVKSSRR